MVTGAVVAESTTVELTSCFISESIAVMFASAASRAAA